MNKYTIGLLVMAAAASALASSGLPGQDKEEPPRAPSGQDQAPAPLPVQADTLRH